MFTSLVLSVAASPASSTATFRMISLQVPGFVALRLNFWHSVPSRAETFVRLIQMPLHGAARGRTVVRCDRLDDRTVLGERGLPQPRRVVMMLELLVQGPAPLLPEHSDDVNERAIAGRLRDAQMKQAIGVDRRCLGSHFLVHELDRFLDRGDLRFLGRLCGERSTFAFDYPARAKKLEGAGCGLDFVAFVAGMTVAEHIDARANSHLDQPFH